MHLCQCTLAIITLAVTVVETGDGVAHGLTWTANAGNFPSEPVSQWKTSYKINAGAAAVECVLVAVAVAAMLCRNRVFLRVVGSVVAVKRSWIQYYDVQD